MIWLHTYGERFTDPSAGRLVALEAPQADLMERILNGELIKLAHIRKELDEGEGTAAASK